MALALAGAVPWLFASDVLRLVAYRRDVLLGRYSLGWFAGCLALTGLLWTGALLYGHPRRPPLREWMGRAALLGLAIAAGAALVDAVARGLREPRYVERVVEVHTDWIHGGDLRVRHRPADQRHRLRYLDVPPTARTYPSAPPGYPPVEITLTIDHRGYRNRTALQRADVAVVGDSFAEGSRVSDEQVWTVRLGEALGRSVYDLGISGGDPEHFLEALRVFGVDLAPETAIVMLYEGNDFEGRRDARGEDPLEAFVESSPVIRALGTALVRVFGPLRADAPVPGGEILAWMPVAVPAGAGARYYAFRPTRLMRLYRSAEEIRRSDRWAETAEVLDQILALCRQHAIRPVFVYVPSKPHVVMPLAADRVPPEALRAFAALKRRDLPEADVFARRLYGRLGDQQRVVREFARERGVTFVSTTRALARATAAGRQTYYTYDQHWTPEGHEIASAEIARVLGEPGS